MVTAMVWECLSKAGKGPPFGQFEAAHFWLLQHHISVLYCYVGVS